MGKDVTPNSASEDVVESTPGDGHPAVSERIGLWDWWTDVARSRKDAIEILLLGFIGFLTWRLSNKANEITENQNTIMNQQVQLQAINTAPHFIAEDWFSSPIGDRAPSRLVIKNLGGWAHYIQLEVQTHVDAVRVIEESDTKYILAPITIKQYFNDAAEVVEADAQGQEKSWELSSSDNEDRFEDFFEDLQVKLQELYGIEDVEYVQFHSLTMRYIDYQRQPSTDSFNLSDDGELWSSSVYWQTSGGERTDDHSYQFILDTWSERGTDWWNDLVERLATEINSKYNESF